MNNTLQQKIVKGEVDINNSQLFISTLVRALLYKLNKQVYLRNKSVPHFILNTGDDIMYLENKGQDNLKEPINISNEDYIYNSVPRCIVDIDTLEAVEDQLTNPYTRGMFDFGDNTNMYSFNAEFRRMPLKLSVKLKYYLDSFNDVMTISQYIITKMLFVQNLSFDYLGQKINATYKVPTSFSHDKTITFDGGTTDSKLRTIELSLDIETNMPVYDTRTVVCNENYISILKDDIIKVDTTSKNNQIIGNITVK